MEDSDDEDAKLKEEIEAELDKISISSLEKDEIESDSVSDTESDGSDTGLDELPESMLHCISVIQNKRKATEELILQDLEDPDAFSCCYGAFSSNYIHLRVGLSTESKDSSEQLMKVLSGIEKEEFMRRKTHCARPDLIPQPDPQDITGPQEVTDPQDVPDPQDVLVFADDSDMNFGYFEVEERCRKSFEAWQDKQKEIEDKEKETLKAWGDREREKFQEEEEKRHCWIQQFELERKKLEDIQKQEQDKMNDELQREEELWKEKSRQHEEFIRNLHLQMEEERARFNELQEKEKSRLLEVQHSAAVKIQAKYKAYIAYKKYGLIIREQIESKRRKAQEWKEKEAKIRQKEEERQKRLEEEHRIEEAIKRKMQEERKRREKEYEDKKNILRKEREELRNREKIQSQEDTGQHLIINCALRKRDCTAKHVAVTDKNKGTIAQKLKEANSRKHSVCVVEQLDKGENVDSQLIFKESIDAKLVSSKAILAKLNVNKKSENLAKQQCLLELVKKEVKYESIEKPQLENKDIVENMNEQFQLQEFKSQVPTKESVEHTTHEEMGGIQVNGHNEEMNELKNPEVQKIIKGNQQKAEEEDSSKQSESLLEQSHTPVVSMEENQLLLKLENCETTGGHVILEDKEVNLKSKELEEFSKGNTLSSDTVISITDAMANTEIKKQKYRLVENAPTEDLGSYYAGSFQATTEAHSLQSKIQEIQSNGQKNGAARESIKYYSIPEATILSSIEEQRKAWVTSCRSWLEILKEYQQKKIIKRRRTMKCPTNMMPPLSTLDILQCGPWDTLQQVTTITLQGLPGCSLSTLADCPNLQFLSLQRCGLVSLNGLSHCRKLKFIDAQENYIEAINCENMENLSIVLLNKNQLTSIHGLDGCTNIQNLELSYNKITRIGGLESLKCLQQLTVDHNQLISSKGLCDAPTIVYLDCSYNHLTDLEGIENCGLLQILKLEGNFLSEPPPLKNHVLLRELHLDDNSISTVEAFSSYWLPLLQDLTLSQNRLTNIVPLFHFVSLEKLDISNNCLSDLTCVMKWLGACYSLRELSLTGNPLLKEVNGRNSLLKTLPALRIFNGEMVTSSSEIPTEGDCHPSSGGFLALCQSQIQEFSTISENYTTQKGDVFTLEAVENLCDYFKKLMELSNECRYAHEHGDLSITETVEAEVQHNHLAFSSNNNTPKNMVFQSQTNKHNTNSPDINEKLIDFDSMNTPLSCEDMEGINQKKIVGQKMEDGKPSCIPTERITFVETVMIDSPLSNHQNIEHCETISAAMIIQAYWRGYIVRRQRKFSENINLPDKEPLLSPLMHNQTTVKKEGRGNAVNIQEQREMAALCIQAVWKGFILRKKLVTALEAINSEESGEEYEEINLEDFIFDEAALEKEWLALASTRFPSQTLLLSNQLHWPKNSGIVKIDDNSLNIPSLPAQAWLCNEKDNVSSSEHTQLNSRSESGTISWTPASKTSPKSLLKSEKEERISEEWGFKDISTAQQMLKRAEKMKSKKLKKKIDPTVRLALFKNNENKVSVKNPSKKKQVKRYDYFEAKGIEARQLHMLSEDSTTDLHSQPSSLCREQKPEDRQSPSRLKSEKIHRLKATRWRSDGLGLLMFFSGHRRQAPPATGKAEDIIYKDTSLNEKLERSKEYTYRWLHTQTGIHETNISRNMKCEHFLPELDPDVLNGGRVQLVARLVSREDTDLDFFSMTSGSALSVNREKKIQVHRHSAGSSSCPSNGVLTPMVTNTRPSKKERISFRDNPVRFSGGWGSGKKKVKTSS